MNFFFRLGFGGTYSQSGDHEAGQVARPGYVLSQSLAMCR